MSISAAIEDSDALTVRLVGETEARFRLMYGKRARAELATKAGVAPGTLENLQRGRHKGLRGRVRDKLLGFVAQEIQREISRLEHDLELALRSASRPDEAAVCEARAALDKARRLIGARSPNMESN